MSYDPDIHTGRLRRLAPNFYRGAAWVHWSMVLDDRQKGWLDEVFHLQVREMLLHTLAKYNLICPVYCLMPDHGHFLFGGLKRTSDQRLAVRYLRKEWNRLLAQKKKGAVLQKQAYDHVLTEKERERGAFQAVSWYILQNPKRAELVSDELSWLFSGSVAVGYPDLDPQQAEASAFWEKFWKIYEHERDWDNT